MMANKGQRRVDERVRFDKRAVEVDAEDWLRSGVRSGNRDGQAMSFLYVGRLPMTMINIELQARVIPVPRETFASRATSLLFKPYVAEYSAYPTIERTAVW